MGKIKGKVWRGAGGASREGGAGGNFVTTKMMTMMMRMGFGATGIRCV